jgi:hypothetical protein
VALRRSAAAQVTALLQPCVEPFQKFDVEPADLRCPEPRRDVQPDQVLVPVAGRLLQVGDLQPLLDRLAHSDRGLRVLVLVDLVEQACQCLLGLVVGADGLGDVAAGSAERVNAGVRGGPEAARRQLLDVAAATATSRHGRERKRGSVRTAVPRLVPRTRSEVSWGG